MLQEGGALIRPPSCSKPPPNWRKEERDRKRRREREEEAADDFGGSLPKGSAAKEGGGAKEGKGSGGAAVAFAMSDGEQEELQGMLRSLVAERGKVREAMGWCITRSQYAADIVETVTEALTIAATPPPKKIAPPTPTT